MKELNLFLLLSRIQVDRKQIKNRDYNITIEPSETDDEVNIDDLLDIVKEIIINKINEEKLDSCVSDFLLLKSL
ncbi:hypothetical protein RJG79_08335 [Mycoplasmatota bacterium WC44]